MNTEDAPLLSTVTPSTLRAILVEPSPSVEGAVMDVLTAHGYDVVCVQGFPDGLETAALVVVEAGRDWRAITLIKRIHRLCPDLPLVGVLPWWDEDERDVAGVADFILHVPVREDQLRGLARLAAVAPALQRSRRVPMPAAT